MSSKDQIEKAVSEINSQISSCSKALLENNNPDFDRLSKLVSEFTENLKKISDSEAAEYFKLIKVWSDEIKKIIDKVSSDKDNVQAQIEGAMFNSKAFGSYTKMN